MTLDRPEIALVLSGGSTRGAYEVGVVAGIVEVLGLRPSDVPPFRVFVGTSVGAINAAWLAAHADRGDMAVDGLIALWSALRIDEFLQVDLFGWGLFGSRPPPPGGSATGHGLLRPGAVERLVSAGVPWEALHGHIVGGRVRALLIPALEIATGRTTIFADLMPGVSFPPSSDPSRRVLPTRVTADHVLASAAIPVLYPPRRIGDQYYYDGGLRSNTPISPAIRVGSDRLVVISPLLSEPPPVEVRAEQPPLGFLLGKALNALLLDPMAHDLQVLERFNRLVEALEEALSPEELERVNRLLVESRGTHYRRIATLSFTPTADLGKMAAAHIREDLDNWRLDRSTRWLLRRLVGPVDDVTEADWTSFILFDGGYARKLIAAGRADALSRTDEIRRFFR